MSAKYVFFSSDDAVNRRLRTVLPDKELTVKKSEDFPDIDPGCKLVLLDGDALSPDTCKKGFKTLKRKKIPVVYLFNTLSGSKTMDLLNKGVVSVLFKDYSPTRIKKELKDILFNFRYLESVKELAENDARAKRFMEVVKTLTSDNDINTTMISILNVMMEVFDLESTVFFVAAGGKLKQKIALGKGAGAPREWDLTDDTMSWFADIRESQKPLYIKSKTKNPYEKDFKANTVLLPLVIKEKFLGMIAATIKPASRRLSDNEIALLGAFAGQTAVALENAKLYRDVIRTREQLVEEEKRSLLGQIALSLNHEINNPLAVISMEAQLLQQRMTHKEEKTEKRLTNIETNIERIKNILETISALDMEGQLLTEEYLSGKKMLRLHHGH